MAKLFTSYPLCSIDLKTFLGVADDQQDGNVILTTGNKIVFRYRLEDQKQLNSWKNLDKLTSVVVYAVDLGKYVGVFDYNLIKIWAESEQLEEVKKYKFEDSIFSILTSKILNKSFVIFQNGTISHLSEALETRKESHNKNIFKSNEILESCTLCSHNGIDYVAFFTQNIQDKNVYLVSVEDNTIKKSITSKNKSNPLNSWCIMPTEDQINLITLWTDGTMYSLNLFNRLYHSEFPGNFIQKFDSIDFYKSVGLLPLGHNHLVIYGSDVADEGASMIVYSFKFHIIQARHHYKFFSNPPFLGKVNNNILVTVGNNLGVLPYELKETLLSSVIGVLPPQPMKKIDLTDWIGDNQKIKILNDDDTTDLDEDIKVLIDKGLPQSRISDEIISKSIEEKDVHRIMWILENFQDITENRMVDVLRFALNSDESLFTNLVKKECQAEEEDEDEEEVDVGPLTSPGRRHLIDQVLIRNVDRLELISHLGKLTLDHILLLMKHIGFLLKMDIKDNIDTWCRWADHLIDYGSYDFFVSTDPEIKKIIDEFQEMMDIKVAQKRANDDLGGPLNCIFSQKPNMRNQSTIKKNQLANQYYSNKIHSIENIATQKKCLIDHTVVLKLSSSPEIPIL